jgi:hypothetical protein
MAKKYDTIRVNWKATSVQILDHHQFTGRAAGPEQLDQFLTRDNLIGAPDKHRQNAKVYHGPSASGLTASTVAPGTGPLLQF